MSEAKLSMKLLIDTKAKRVLYAEAGKDCVDFLFYILSLPVSILISLIGKQGIVGSLANLYESLQTIDASYMQSIKARDALLEPVAPLSGYSVPLLSLKKAPASSKNFYKCIHGSSRAAPTFGAVPMFGVPSCSATCHSVSDVSGTICPTSGRPMTQPMSYVAHPSIQEPCNGEGGFVNGLVTYMVMDDLVVTPLSTAAITDLLNKFDVKNVCVLEYKEVDLGMEEVVKLLNASLARKTVLTDVFIKEMQ